VTQGRVEFNQVSFAYPGKNKVLKDISFTIEPGQKVAIVVEALLKNETDEASRATREAAA
ncbi:MAG: hypothetical protein ABGX41_06755, partial [Pseudohongiella sp.]